ncbi:MAG TPA: L,D-transpeptidase family protein [Acidimicrobiales bacterium]
MAATSPTRPARRPLLALLAGLATIVVGAVVVSCATTTDEAAAPVASTTTSRAPTTTRAPATTTTVAFVPYTPGEPTRSGDAGAQVTLLQQRLYDLGYFLPGVTGSYDADTTNAVMAFQKLHGLARDGVAGPDTITALATATKVAPAHGTGAHLEVSLDRQLLIVVDGAGGAVAVNATTGAAATATPPGSYGIFRQVNGWDPGPYGSLYRPKYFTGGIAFHGGVPVLASPASHGCVRLPDRAVDWLWSSGLAPIGASVLVT